MKSKIRKKKQTSPPRLVPEIPTPCLISQEFLFNLNLLPKKVSTLSEPSYVTAWYGPVH
jgi:hypothetical protein